MKLSKHADRTEQLVGIRAEDIHKWIDGFFDSESFDQFLRTGSRAGFNPYNHRKYRHCAEALEDAYRVFGETYTREQIKAVFESHIQDDYDGFIPLQEDFENGTFAEKYHEAEEPPEQEKILSEEELTAYFKGKAYAHAAAKTGARGLSARFYWHIVWPAVLAASLFAVSAFTVIVPVFRRAMMDQKKEMIKELVATASSAIGFYIGQEKEGALTREEAQRQAADEVGGLRYGVGLKDYFWITDMHPRMVMHPYRPELVGRDLTGYTDRMEKGGTRLFDESVALVKAEGEGYLEYLWQWMDDPRRAEPKLSYVQGIPEWGWVIGTGVYIHDVEQEIARLSRNLLVADGVIAVLLLGLLANVVWQSRRIEYDRVRAESGLREAKNRYRALVEGSNEGYLLEVAGETVYSNHTLRRMTGYGEAELAAMKAWELLEPGCEINAVAEGHLRNIYRHSAASSEFEARLKTRHGEPLDVVVSTARIFFSAKNGHVVSFSEIRRGQQHTLQAFYRSDAPQTGSDSDIANRIAAAETDGQVIQTLKQLPDLVRAMTDRGVRAGILRETIGTACDAAIQRFIELSIETDGKPPVAFAFLSLGSNARHEMTMFSDQDNALVFADVPAERLTEVRRRFLALADDVCGKLNKAGYPYCPGGILAANPKWCLSLAEWKAGFSKWISAASPEAILEVNVSFDLRCTYGEAGLVNALRAHVQTRMLESPEFFIHYAQNCLGYKVPRMRRHKDTGRLNLKECIKPIETFARLYALRHAIEDGPGTLDRLKALRDAEVLQEETFREMAFVFDYLWQLRFFNQISTTAELSTETDELDLGRLTAIEHDNLHAVLARIPIFQSKLSYDFLGMQL